MSLEQIGLLIDPDIAPEAIAEDNNAKPTVSDLIQNMRGHVENLEDEIAQDRPGESSWLWLDTLQADLDLIERALADFQCTMRGEIDRL